MVYCREALELEAKNLALYIRAFGFDQHAAREEKRIQLVSSQLNTQEYIYKTPVYSYDVIQNLGMIPRAIADAPPICAYEAAKIDDAKKQAARTRRELESAVREYEPAPEADKYLFSEAAYNMTGWANLNYGTRSY